MNLSDIQGLSHAASQLANFQQVQDLPPSFLFRVTTALEEQAAKIATLERTQREQVANLEEKVHSKQEEVDTLQNRVIALENKWETLEANVKNAFAHFTKLLFGNPAEQQQVAPRQEESARAVHTPSPVRRVPVNRTPSSARPVSKCHTAPKNVNNKDKEDPKLTMLRQIFQTEKNAALGIGNKILVERFKQRKLPTDRGHVKLLCKKLEAEGLIKLNGSGSARKWYLLTN